MNVSVVVDWKFVAALGFLVLTVKVKAEDATEALASVVKNSSGALVAYCR